MSIIDPLPKNWEVVEFGSVLDGGTRTGIYKQKQFHGTGIKMINMGELFAHPKLKSVPMERIQLSDDEKNRFDIRVGDLIFARRSLVASGAGKCSLVCEILEPTTFESSIIRARPNPKIADSQYLYYLFNSPLGRHLLDTILRQVAVSGITGSDLVKLKIPLPPISTQHTIARILGSLDDKIELNRQMNKTLEAMARAIFQSWFVDFDPVRAKVEGRDTGLPPEIAAMFPDGFEEIDGQEVPKGWEIRPLEKCIQEIYDYRGKTPKKLGDDWSQDGIIAISAKNVKNGTLVNLDNVKYVSDSLYKKWMKSDLVEGDILMTSEAPLGELFYLAQSVKMCLSQRLFCIRANSEIIQPAILYFFLNSPDVRSEIQSRETGTTVTGIRQSLLRTIPVLVPSSNLQEDIVPIFNGIMLKIDLNNEQSRKLAQIRDALLPKLMSGEIRVYTNTESSSL